MTLLTQQQLRQKFREETGRPLSHQDIIRALQEAKPMPSVRKGKRRFYDWAKVAAWFELEPPVPALQSARDAEFLKAMRKSA